MAAQQSLTTEVSPRRGRDRRGRARRRRREALAARQSRRDGRREKRPGAALRGKLMNDYDYDAFSRSPRPPGSSKTGPERPSSGRSVATGSVAARRLLDRRGRGVGASALMASGSRVSTGTADRRRAGFVARRGVGRLLGALSAVLRPARRRGDGRAPPQTSPRSGGGA